MAEWYWFIHNYPYIMIPYIGYRCDDDIGLNHMLDYPLYLSNTSVMDTCIKQYNGLAYVGAARNQLISNVRDKSYQ